MLFLAVLEYRRVYSILAIFATQPLGVTTRRTTTQQMRLIIPRAKCYAFARKYGNPSRWQGKTRPELLNLSELEILMIYNAEIRGFLGYYSLADNLTSTAAGVLWLTSASFY